MKLVVITISIILSFSAYSQIVNYLVNEEGLWSTVDVHCEPGGTDFNTYFTKFEEDTLIDGYTYKNIWRSTEEELTNWTPDGFIRENGDGQVFLRPPNYIEGLIYDFGANPGDTVEALNVYLSSSSYLHFVVTQVDSILLLDRYRKRITLYEYINQQEEIWIEGLGSYYGILNSCAGAYGAVCGGGAALCYKENSSLVYQNPEYSTCYYSVFVGTNHFKIENFQVYPNPAKDFVSIKFSSDGERLIELSDISGKKIVKKMYFEKNVLLDLHKVDSGIYFLNIFDNDNNYQSYKLIVD